MKASIMIIALLAAVTMAEDRGQLEFYVGGGVWMPALLDSDAQLTPGVAVTASLGIPPSLGNVFVISTGYLSAGSDRAGFEGISAVPLTVGYRMFPLYRRFAGPRGIEPLLGIYGGGMLLWDSPEGTQDDTSTGAGVIGAELGARISISETVSFDLVVSPEWVGTGSSLAGEGKDLTGLRITGSLAF
jgi:hypothetical protein